MKITFPHLGNVCFAAKALFDELGIECIVPPFNNKEALKIGTLYSPEEICLPFKIMIGNYLQSIEKGADTILITGSCGPCRFGEYCELQIELLKKLNKKVDFIVMDVPSDIGIKELIRRIGKISAASNRSKSQKVKALYKALKIQNLIDGIEADAHYISGYEKNKGECKRLLNRCKSEAINAKGADEMIDIISEYSKKINSIEVDDSKNPLKIALVGEIYTIIEPFSNLYIEDKLMDYGVSTKRVLTPSWWVKNTFLSPLKINSLDIKSASKNYIPLCIGGHAMECVGESVIAKNEGFDGVIQIFPMGCMPEIVSKAVLPSISKDLDIPIMSLVVDEMTGEAGYVTRLEAFIDLLERRRQSVLSWS
ncbi:2-hydroxyglutaryl-CoA dehydratase [Caloramator sp. E03]|uniref:acyl-CoA dehydratase activase-related protein n=1 Tax=Caloramator sp. E03 TaxID=2576307 RepID=UPI0011109296|nr:acyl-CoA dehydratase activase-related protein [Caloramator sp. E03]QCX34555.1 2-hydroxyglutaryl-CoA dehydratase [Caloramator sp. E03]